MPLMRLIRALAASLFLPLHLAPYLHPGTGRAYGLDLTAKVRLALRMRRAARHIPSASSWIVHLAMATQILRTAPLQSGAIVECGCFKGASSASLSLVAKATGRRMHIFDSFEGLPEPEEEDRAHVVLSKREVHTYTRGAFAGALEDVKANVARYGAIDVCEFHKGFVEDTLPTFDEPVAFAYVDVDLVSAERTCLQYLWPLLGDGCFLFTDEAHHLEIAECFYDRAWWQATLATEPPGLVGAGSGLGLFPAPGGARSSVGYAVKNPAALGLTERPG